ncbi:hypothetical protein BV22DRAFT_1013432 [Leucogyrophana mollusca]|uniref:Uncharacterized protein n=1 Tax=Leucogyrophana mollusca TaxID=85980 RepID=A0ACB8BFY7_9AGAM|nr:hypothetical protein BV22DRAFT_1013432 [Leucogyrophana mollusca]
MSSNEDIIRQQATSLQDKSHYQSGTKFQPKSTATSDESGVNEAAVAEFPGASVHVGRTGQTGGGTSSQFIPPDEGGEDQGTASHFYDSPTFGGRGNLRAHVREADPSINVRGDSVWTEVSGTGAATGRRPQRELAEAQTEGARSQYV